MTATVLNDVSGRKKAKNTPKPSSPPASTTADSKKFTKLCNVGVISGGAPGSLEKRGSQFFLTVPTGRSFQIYDVESLQLLFTSRPELDAEIAGVLGGPPGDRTYVAAGRAIQVFERASWVGKLKTRNEHILGMICLEEWLLGLSSKRLHVFNAAAKSFSNCEYSIDFDGEQQQQQQQQQPTTMLHPNTYLNKVLVGFNNGSLQLWNIKSKTLLHTFEPFTAAILTIAQSPVNDIVAVGLADGQVWLLDILQAKRLFSLSMGGPFTSLSFRFDPEHPQLGVAMCSGEILIWDLNDRILKERIVAHEGRIGSVHFITGHPMMVSHGEDNSVKIWVAEPTFRLLKHRAGHRGPASLVKFYGEAGKSLLSAGQDGSLHYTSLIKASQSFQFAHGTPESKLKKFVNETRSRPVSDLSFFITKDLKWDNIVSIHEGSTAALPWRGDLKAMGKHVLHPEVVGGRREEEKLTKSAISPCGNYTILGGVEGGLYVFNLQSGLLKKSAVAAAVPSKVVGLLVRSDNETLLVAYESGLVQIREFKSLKVVSEMKLEEGIVKTTTHQNMNLAVLGLRSGVIQVFDIELNKIAISRDCKHLVAAFGTSGIWIWDFITGNVVEVLRTDKKPLGIDISASSDLLALSFDRSIGMSLWVNNFEAVQNPSITSYLLGNDQGSSSSSLTDARMNYLSDCNLSKLLNLLAIDTIKSSSRPFEQIKRKALPFFLDAQFDRVGKEENDTAVDEPNTAAAFIDTQNGLVAKLVEYRDGKISAQAICQGLMAQSIGSIDFELKTLVYDTEAGGDRTILHLFLRFLIDGLEGGCNFDAYQTFMNVILKLHYPLLRSSLTPSTKTPLESENHDDDDDGISKDDPETGALLRQLFQAHLSGWRKIEGLFQQSLCLEAFCKNDF